MAIEPSFDSDATFAQSVNFAPSVSVIIPHYNDLDHLEH